MRHSLQASHRGSRLVRGDCYSRCNGNSQERELFRLEREQVRVNGAAFRSANRYARVIEIPGATHFLFLSNQAETLRDIRAFVISLR